MAEPSPFMNAETEGNEEEYYDEEDEDMEDNSFEFQDKQHPSNLPEASVGASKL
jgi:hypothetical protein